MAEPKVVTTLEAVAAGNELAPLLHATGIQGTMDWMEYLAAQGYVFIGATSNLGNFDDGEDGADNQDIDPLEPSFMFDVPTGVTVIPLWANVAFEDITGTDNILAICTCANNTYSTGGVAALGPYNARTDDKRTSRIKNYYASGETPTAITAGAATRIRTLWHWASVTDGTGGDPFVVEWRPVAHAYLVGPASFLFYCHSITTEASYRATFSWAEIDSAFITQP